MAKYVASKFNVTVKVSDGGFVLFQTMTGAVTKIKREHSEEVQEMLCNGTGGNVEFLSALVKQGHLVEKGMDEIGALLTRRCSTIHESKVFDLILLTTLQCNFACKYCYEVHRDEIMDAVTVQSIKKFLSRSVDSFDTLHLYWFGGEPLYNAAPIFEFTAYANELCCQAGKHIRTNITTNGYLLDKYLREIEACNITDFQITLDGDRAHHDFLRPLQSGEPTYDVIINNIKKLLKNPNTYLTLRMNINKENMTTTHTVLEEFPQAIRGRIRISLEPIFGDTTFACDVPHVLTATLLDTYREAEELGYMTLRRDFFRMRPEKFIYCYAEREHQLAISPSGKLFKCTARDFTDKNSVGNLSGDGKVNFTEAYTAWMSRGDDFPPICKQCSYLPLCMGGCRNNYKALLTKNGESCKIAAQHYERIKSILIFKHYI